MTNLKISKDVITLDLFIKSLSLLYSLKSNCDINKLDSKIELEFNKLTQDILGHLSSNYSLETAIKTMQSTEGI